MRLRVVAPEGCYIPDHGSRKQGEVFDLPEDLAGAYLAAYPDKFELEVEVAEAETTLEVN